MRPPAPLYEPRPTHRRRGGHYDGVGGFRDGRGWIVVREEVHGDDRAAQAPPERTDR
jgi:hypothetical protein